MSIRHLNSSLGDTLRQESEAIDNALDDFLRQRNAASQMQAEALAVYERELLNIGDISDEEDDGGPEGTEGSFGGMYGSSIMGGNPTAGTVDHNVRRQNKLTTNDDVNIENDDDNYDDDDIYDDDYDDEFENEDDLLPGMNVGTIRPGYEGMSKSDKKNKEPPKIQIRLTMPAPEVKTSMRKKLFNMMDQGRMEEDDLERELIDLYNRDISTEKEMRALDREINQVADLLLEKQKDNYDKLTNFLEDYQPKPSGTAWGNDPEYHKMLRGMKGRVDKRFNASMFLK